MVTGFPVFVLGNVLVVYLLLLRRELLVYVLVRRFMIHSSLLFVFGSFLPYNTTEFTRAKLTLLTEYESCLNRLIATER